MERLESEMGGGKGTEARIVDGSVLTSCLTTDSDLSRAGRSLANKT